MSTPLQIERATKVLNEARQVLQTVSERPAIVKTGHRGTVIAYAELTRLKQWLSECVSLLTLTTDPRGIPLTYTESFIVDCLRMRPMTVSQVAASLAKSPRVSLEILDELIKRGVIQRTTEGALQFYRLIDSSGIAADDDRDDYEGFLNSKPE